VISSSAMFDSETRSINVLSLRRSMKVSPALGASRWLAASAALRGLVTPSRRDLHRTAPLFLRGKAPRIISGAAALRVTAGPPAHNAADFTPIWRQIGSI
jgi:hypothetical protein